MRVPGQVESQGMMPHTMSEGWGRDTSVQAGLSVRIWNRMMELHAIRANSEAARTVSWDATTLQLCEASPLYGQVTGMSEATLVQKQYEVQAIDTFLSEALKDFDKEARRYKISREGVITETTFPASDPPNRYPNFLASDCNWRDGTVQTVYQINNGLMVHTRPANIKPFYPRLGRLPMNSHHLGAKPRGMFTTLGSMWFDFRIHGVMSDLYQIGRLPEQYPEPTSAAKQFEIVTVSVNPEAFTWVVQASNVTKNILVVDSKQQWDAVEAAFGNPEKPYEHQIDWDKLAELYAGIDVRVGQSNKLSQAPDWVQGWDVIGPCIWDLAAVEAELQVRTFGNPDAAYAWVKAQEAKATSLQILLDNRDNKSDHEEDYAAYFRCCMVMRACADKWRMERKKAARAELRSVFGSFPGGADTSRSDPAFLQMMAVFKAMLFEEDTEEAPTEQNLDVDAVVEAVKQLALKAKHGA